MDPILEELNRERRKRYRERARRRRRVVLAQKITLAAVVIAIIATTIIVATKEEKKPINTHAATDSEELKTEPEATPTEGPTTQAPPKFQEQHSMDWDAEESYLLAKIAMAEAEGESTEGKAMVIMVVLNRVWAEGFPDTIEEVILQHNEKTGVYQFTPVMPGGQMVESGTG